MATISKTSSSSGNRRSNPVKKSNSSQSRRTESNNRPQDRNSTRGIKTKDRTQFSEELKDSKQTRADRKSDKKSRDKEERDKDLEKDKTTENKETKDEDSKRMEDKLSNLERQIQDMKNQAQQQQQPQQGGGCCGGGDKGEKSDKAAQANPLNAPMATQPNGMQGPDNELQNLASQVLQLSGRVQGNGLQPTVFNGQSQNPQAQALKQTLGQKCSQYASQGFQPQPATRVLCQQALTYDPFQMVGTPTMGSVPGMGVVGSSATGMNTLAAFPSLAPLRF